MDPVQYAAASGAAASGTGSFPVPTGVLGTASAGTVTSQGVSSRPDAASMLAGSPEPLARALHRCATEQLTAAIQVTGEPGGVVHVSGGQVVAVETPGAPGVETQLLRSGRLSESDWSAAVGGLAAAGPSAAGGLGAELVARKLVSASELERLAVAAVFDGAFAIVAGQVVECRLAQADPFWLPAQPPVPAVRLWQEIERRRQVLSARREPVAHDRDRLVPVSQVGRGTAVSPEQWAILRHADGRRTPRDLAFVLGRGVYAVTLEIARLLDSGLVQVASRRDVPRLDGSAPEPPAAPPQQTTEARYDSQPYDAETPRLPRRRPGSSAMASEPGQQAGRWAVRLPHAWASRSPGE
jgi:hypothetical protein